MAYHSEVLQQERDARRRSHLLPTVGGTLEAAAQGIVGDNAGVRRAGGGGHVYTAMAEAALAQVTNGDFYTIHVGGAKTRSSVRYFRKAYLGVTRNPRCPTRPCMLCQRLTRSNRHGKFWQARKTYDQENIQIPNVAALRRCWAPRMQQRKPRPRLSQMERVQCPREAGKYGGAKDRYSQ